VTSPCRYTVTRQHGFKVFELSGPSSQADRVSSRAAGEVQSVKNVRSPEPPLVDHPPHARAWSVYRVTEFDVRGGVARTFKRVRPPHTTAVLESP
jgi:hypothetical protein